MGFVVELPEVLVREVSRLGVDVEGFIIDSVIARLNLDPGTELEVHLELAERFLREGVELVSKDPVQASEKLYKAAEEAVKAMAIALGLDEARTASEQGRWTAALLFRAVDSISDRLGREEVRLWWGGRAWFLHVEGFHEARLGQNQVGGRDLKYVEALVRLAQECCREARGGKA
ncbi:PaREP1 family protein [Vulcanisaeta distributa]|uniref:PaREP1 family protein n=1 Tax=Vulcanisaeta distributa TaxID=164451 RepID=UPI0006D04867|nr:PaREP1 family protein [Vulcanisaeta distributa]